MRGGFRRVRRDLLDVLHGLLVCRVTEDLARICERLRGLADGGSGLRAGLRDAQNGFIRIGNELSQLPIDYLVTAAASCGTSTRLMLLSVPGSSCLDVQSLPSSWQWRAPHSAKR